MAMINKLITGISTVAGIVLGVYLVNMFFEEVLGATTGFTLITDMF